MKAQFSLVIMLCLGSVFNACSSSDTEGEDDQSQEYRYRDDMRTFIKGISAAGKSENPNFLVIPQNGIELVVQGEEPSDTPALDYLNAIDANGQEDLFYGYDEDDNATEENNTVYIRSFLDVSKNAGKAILVTDYVSTHTKMDDSYTKNQNAGYVSFAANHRELNNIPDFPTSIYGVNTNNITGLGQVKNFLYLINPGDFSTKNAFVAALSNTNYDLLIIDLFFNDGTTLTSSQINQLKLKANGGSRLVICYMSIGEAEDYRYYWDEKWASNPPSWLDAENPEWEGNYKVRYWDENWQKIIYGNQDSYLQKIQDANFDGVYLDLVDAFEYYE